MSPRSALVRRLERLVRVLRFAAAMFGMTVALIVLGHYGAGLAMYVKNDLLRPSDLHDARQLSPVYDDFPEAAELWRATNEAMYRHHFEPYIHWQRDPYTSKHVNVEAGGVRRTVKRPEPGAAKVFMFGGSTLWGVASPDGDTIPSLLQKRLGNGYDVHNFGDIAYVAAQEFNLLAKLLADGNVPQIVIFYDGINDGAAGAYAPGIPRDPEAIRTEWARREQAKQAGPLAAAFRQSSYPQLAAFLQRLLGLAPRDDHAAWDKHVAPHIDARAKKVVDYYGAHIRQVRALAKEYGFKAFFFWQPNLLTSRRRPFPCEEAIVKSQSPVLAASQRLVHDHAKKALSGREGEGVFFIGDALDDLGEPTYVDWMHPGPRGNGAVAAKIYDLVRDRI